MIKKSILSVGLLLVALYGIFIMNNVVAKNYEYGVRLGAPREYEMLYDFNKNYLFNEKGKPLLYFTSVGGSPSNDWADGSQATSLFDREPLPVGIHVRWFSVAENQFWEASHLFDQQLLDKLKDYTVNHIIMRSKNAFMGNFDFFVYTVPGGLATVWIAGGGEMHLLAQFQAEKVEEPNWDSFAKSSLQWEEIVSRDEYIKERMNDPDSKMSTITKPRLKAGELLSSAPWKRLMRTYDWSLTVNNAFTLKDYNTWYVNGEKLYTYYGVKETKPKAVPYLITVYIESNNAEKKLNRIDIWFNKDENIAAFEKLSQMGDHNAPIKLYLNITPDFTKLDAFLIKGDDRIELKKINPRLKELYNY